jgi:hypothetical protein
VAEVTVRVDPRELLIAISELAAVVVTVRLETAVSKALKPLPPGSRSALSLASPIRFAALATNVFAVTLFVSPFPSVISPDVALSVTVPPADIAPRTRSLTSVMLTLLPESDVTATFPVKSLAFVKTTSSSLPAV